MASVTIQETDRLTEDSGNVRVHVRISTDGGVTWRADVWVDAVRIDPATGQDNGFDARPRAALQPFWQAYQARQSSPAATSNMKTAATVTLP